MKEKDPEIPDKHHRIGRETAEEVLKKVSKVYGVDEKEITVKRHQVNEARDVGMYLLRKRSGLGLREIAARFGVKYPAVGNRIAVVRKRVEEDGKFKAKVDNIK